MDREQTNGGAFDMAVRQRAVSENLGSGMAGARLGFGLLGASWTSPADGANYFGGPSFGGITGDVGGR